LKLVDCLQLKDAAFNLDGRVRYFGYMDNRQGMVMSELRNKDESHPGESQLVRDLTFFKSAMASWSLYFGRVRYAVVSHEAFMIVMIPIEGGLVIVTAESTLPLEFVDRLWSELRMKSQQIMVSGKL
jgi:hypothetical protein